MKRYIALILLALLGFVVSGRCQGLDDQYFSIFNLIQEADSLSSSEPVKALGKYLQAQKTLQAFQKGNPDWNPQVVNFRLSYVSERLAALSSSAPQPNPPPPAEDKKPAQTPTVGTTTNQPAAAQGPGDLQAEVNALKEQVRIMTSDRALLEAKLKEALSAQPAQMDPRELAKAEQRIGALQKENELLKASIQSEKGKSGIDPKALEQAQTALAEANRLLAQQKEANSKLTGEKEALQARLKSSGDLAALQAENELLKKQVLAAGTNSTTDDSKIRQAQAQIAALQSDKELLRIEKTALENRVKQLTSAASPAPMAAPAELARTRQLERQVEDLQKKLKSALGKKGATLASRVQDLEVQLANARARLDLFEARQVPYTAEELALMKQPPAQLADPEAKPARRSEPPPGSTRLIAQAQRYFVSKEFDKAEMAYNEVLKQDPRNVIVLANLAAIQSESGKLETAESNLKTALAESPEDAFSLYILGITKFRQRKFDESLEALSKAAKLDPQNAEIQNYLGLALSEKGLRAPAETALRRAVQLQPNYAQAHYNLAVAYVSQQPPAVELARWHYQKAVSLGQPRNQDVEKRFEAK